MTKPPQRKSYVVNLKELPEQYPTNQHKVEFWEHLGRTVATYGFLEEILGKAIFALTATKSYPDNTIEQAYMEWLPKLERALTDPLGSLIDAYGSAIREHQDALVENLDDLLDDLRSASQIRNVLCHGSWRVPDKNGASVPLFVNRKRQVFETPIDVLFLRKTQRSVAELACFVISIVTRAGIQFPGSNSPGEAVEGARG